MSHGKSRKQGAHHSKASRIEQTSGSAGAVKHVLNLPKVLMKALQWFYGEGAEDGSGDEDAMCDTDDALSKHVEACSAFLLAHPRWVKDEIDKHVEVDSTLRDKIMRLQESTDHISQDGL